MQGHLTKRSKSSWTIVLTLGRGADGKHRQKWITIRGTKRDAERELARLLNDQNQGTFVAPSKLSFAEYAERWLAFVQTRVAPKTFERYDEIMHKHLAPALGETPLSTLQPLQIQAHYSEALKNGRRPRPVAKPEGDIESETSAIERPAAVPRGLSPRTVLHHHRVLREALRQAVAWRLLAVNPADAVEPPRPPQREITVPTDDEVTKLLDAAKGSRLHAPLVVSVATGCRRGELLAARWSDLDLEANTLAIRRALEETRATGVSFKTPKTAKSRRVIVLSPTLVAILRRHRAEQARERLALGAAYQDNDLVFSDPDGQPWRPGKFTDSFADLARKLKIKTHLHALRHYHATALLKSGTHPKIVSERLGHATVGITLDTYSHALPSLQEQAAAKFETALADLGVKA